jgi:hypothetical protein
MEEIRCGWRMKMEVETVTLCIFYVAITLPQMPLSEIDGVVNLFSARRAKERHLIFDACWRDYLARCEIKFSVKQIAPSAQQRPNFILCFNRK